MAKRNPGSTENDERTNPGTDDLVQGGGADDLRGVADDEDDDFDDSDELDEEEEEDEGTF